MSEKIQTNNTSVQFHYGDSKAAYFQLIAQRHHHERLDRKSYCNIVNYLISQDDHVTGEVGLVERSSYYHKYELFAENDTHILIKKRDDPDDPVIRYLPLEDSFDFLIAVHMAVGHDKPEKFRKAVQEKYAVHESYVDFLLLTCNVCSEKRKRLENELKQESKQLNKKVRVEICDMGRRDGQFKFLLIYSDVDTSYTLLRPLMLKCASEVATEMLNIFAGFGPPAEIRTHESDEAFFTEVLTIINKFCPESQMPEVMTFKGKSNNDLLSLFDAWMAQTGHQNWGIACHLFQWSLNNTSTGIFISESNSLERSTKPLPETPFHNVIKSSHEVKLPEKRKREKIQQLDKPKSIQNDNTIVGDVDSLIAADILCYVCERRILKAYTCCVCHHSVHLFCSHNALNSKSNRIEYTCFLCIKVLEEKENSQQNIDGTVLICIE